MSNLEPVSAQPDWQDSYSHYLPAAENLPSLFEQTVTTHSVENTGSAPLYAPRPSLPHRHSLAQVESRRQPFSSAEIDRSDSAPPTNIGHEDSSRDQEQPYLAASAATYQESPRLESKVRAPTSEVEQPSHHNQRDEDEDHDDDDDEMLDAEERATGEGRAPQTEAERRAERRKMKRFRLTHAQTRFLVGEFANQPHPDAAHRERLSREIPGLSPRQVQVWFQNRRAKLKRMNADDSRQIIHSRRPPEGFDTVQALHSQYGVPYSHAHVVGAPMISPSDYNQGYGDHGLGLRPLMVDPSRRPEHDDQLSSSSLTSPYGQVGYAQPSPVGTNELLSSLSYPGDRHFGSLSSSMNVGHRGGNIYNRHNSVDSYGMQTRQGTRPLHPMQSLSRPRSDSLQSPLRTSMSWKGDSLDYGNYQQSQILSPPHSIRQPPMYQGDVSSNTGHQQQQYSSDTYATTNVLTSPSQNTYASSQTSNSQPETQPQSLSRFRSSSTLGLSLPPQPHYRSIPPQSPSNSGISTTPRTSYANAYSTSGFQSAPLMPSAEFQMAHGRTNVDASRDYHMAQLSAPMTAPMAAPQDFGSAYQSPMNDRGSVNVNNGNTTHEQQAQESQHETGTVGLSVPNEPEQQTQQTHGHEGYGRNVNDGYGMEAGRGSGRKRTFSMSESYEGS